MLLIDGPRLLRHHLEASLDDDVVVTERSRHFLDVVNPRLLPKPFGIDARPALGEGVWPVNHGSS